VVLKGTAHTEVVEREPRRSVERVRKKVDEKAEVERWRLRRGRLQLAGELSAKCDTSRSRPYKARLQAAESDGSEEGGWSAYLGSQQVIKASAGSTTTSDRVERSSRSPWPHQRWRS
jgi:hypothetical protein